ncbi:MAG: exodeoxyribonuclease V subunit gamma, partial [Syntrophales bacterium]|nr:exodeoxyribonuclease V subunit gamma [Syntrophales bacterium]
MFFLTSGDFMAGLHITTSNMMEILAARLADIMTPPLPSPCSPEIVLVGSRGMEKWLSMRLADYHGLCANVSFQLPRAYLLNLLRDATETDGPSDCYLPDKMTWSIMKWIPKIIDQPGFDAIRHYLESYEMDYSQKLHQLSHRIARVFDQYMAYRPEMLLKWETGSATEGDEVWQAELWRLLREDVK